jgi:hypothetical protein
MKLARLTVSLAAILLLGGGYVASQVAVLNGQSAEYALKVDQAPIRFLALVILLAAIALAFVKDKGETP